MFHRLTRKRDAYRVYLLLESITAFCFALIFTVDMVYQVTVVHLNPLQLVLVGTLLETVVLVFEIPTGIVADVFSRRLSVWIGLLLIGFGFTIEGLFPHFGIVLLAQLFWGLGATFTSGATQAWIADEVGEERAGRAFMCGAQIGQMGGLVGIGISAGLGTINVQLPIVLGGLLIIAAGLLMIAIMPENGFKPTPKQDRTTFQAMRHTLQTGAKLVRGRPILLTFLGISAVYGLYSEGFDRLWTAHVLRDYVLRDYALPWAGTLKPVTWIALIQAGASLFSIGITELLRRRVDTANQPRVARILIGMNGLMVGGMLFFALSRHFWLALAALLIVKVLRGSDYLLLDAWLNQHIESNVRATVFSMSSQLNAVGQIAGGPAIGYIGRAGSLRAALTTSAIILSPALALLVRGSRQSLPQTEDIPLSVLPNAE